MTTDTRHINFTDDASKLAFVILASPPSTGIYANLSPRHQMWNDGAVVAYHLKEDADAYKHECDKDRNGWKYSVELISLPIATRGNGWRFLYDWLMEQHNQENGSRPMTAPAMSICPRCKKLFAAMERCDCSFYFSKHGYGFIYRGYYIDTILEIANTGIGHDNGFSLDLGYVLPPDVSEDELDKILLLI